MQLEESEHRPAFSASSLQGPNVKVFRLACLKPLCAIWPYGLFLFLTIIMASFSSFLLSLDRPIIDSDPFSTELVLARKVLRNIVQLMPDAPTVMS